MKLRIEEKPTREKIKKKKRKEDDFKLPLKRYQIFTKGSYWEGPRIGLGLGLLGSAGWLNDLGKRKSL